MHVCVFTNTCIPQMHIEHTHGAFQEKKHEYTVFRTPGPQALPYHTYHTSCCTIPYHTILEHDGKMASAARARGSGADHNPTWQLFTPAWHARLWSDRVATEHCIFRFQVCLRLSWTSTLLAVGITPTTTARLFKRYPRFTNEIYREAGSFLRTSFTEGCDGVNYQTLPPGRSNVLYL